MDSDRTEFSAAESEKSTRAFRTITEVAATLDVPQHVLRFWETKFTQIRPLKRGGNRRYYRPEDVDIIIVIKTLLYREGYTIKGVQKRFKEQGVRSTVEQVLEQRPEQRPEQQPEPAAEAAAQEPEPCPNLSDILAELRALRRMLD